MPSSSWMISATLNGPMKKPQYTWGIRCPRDRGQRFFHLIRQPELLNYLADVDKHNSHQSLVISSPVDVNISLEIRIIRYAGSSLLLVAGNVTDIQRTNLMRKDFIANASHELRTPLTVISGYLEAIDNEADDFSREWRPRIKQMRSQTGRMQNLIEDLLKLSRLESKPSADLDNEVDMTELIRLIQQEAQTLSADQNHVFSLEIQPDLIVKGDQDSLYSAYSNIVFNRGAIHTSRWGNPDKMVSDRHRRLFPSGRFRRGDPGRAYTARD